MAVVRNIPKGARKLSEEVSPETEEVVEAEITEGSEDKISKKAATSKKVCFFHKNKTEPAYWDTATLRKFLNDRGRINPRSRTGTCAKHQRRVGKEIKRSRFMALLPYTASI